VEELPPPGVAGLGFVGCLSRGCARAASGAAAPAEDACVHAAPLRLSTEASRVCVKTLVCRGPGVPADLSELSRVEIFMHLALVNVSDS
jgi:hypothetical protein